MNTSAFNPKIWFASVLAIAATMAACTKQPLTPLTQGLWVDVTKGTVDARFCTTPSVTYRQKLKYIFVLDKSSSNQGISDAGSVGSVIATDPFGLRRYRPLDLFLRNSYNDPGFTYYALINFSSETDPGARDAARLVTRNFPNGFTDDLTAFRGVVNAEWNRLGPQYPADTGYTDYLAALDMVRDLIDTDARAASNVVGAPPVTSVYQVIFVSDGVPLILDANSPPLGQRLETFEPEIHNSINVLEALRADPMLKTVIDDINLNTGYYFQTEDTAAREILAQMAAVGRGRAYTFGAGVNIDYTLFAVPVRNVRHLMTDVMVENHSVVFWDDGRLMRDTDGDGLPDQIEAQLGSDATLADSDGNGVSDGVEYRTSGRPCKDVRCGHDILLRNNYAICEGFKNHVEPDGVNASPYGTLIMNDRDHDGLNDCEEMILNSDPTDFDSNLNGLTDFLEFKNRLPFIAGTNAAFSDPDSDRMTNYTEIKTGMPPFVPNGKLTGITPSKYDIVKESSEGGVDCYHLTVNDISIIGPNNQMRVYLMENTAAIDARRTLRVAIGSLREFETTVTFNNDDFR